MELFIFILLFAILIMLVVLTYIFLNKRDTRGGEGDHVFLLLQQQLQSLSTTLDARLRETTRASEANARSQFKESRELILAINREVNDQLRHVAEGVSVVSESSKQVFKVAEQLQDLEKVLKHQKQRGNLGEASLMLALENMLPATAYKRQYQFNGGDIVDAVIVTKDGLIPVDAKFSLDNYRRLTDVKDEAERVVLEKEFTHDLKKRIDETAKYIRPHDGTLPFAFMYIPAEAIYYDLLVNEMGATRVNTRSLIDYAYKDKNVIIVSPTTFSAYLQSVLYGFRAFKIEESALQIGKHVETLSRHLRAYDDYFKKVGNSLGTTVNHYNAAQKELGKIDKDVTKITGASLEVDELLLERPATPD